MFVGRRAARGFGGGAPRRRGKAGTAEGGPGRGGRLSPSLKIRRYLVTEKNMVRADFYTSIILMAFGIAAVALALRMPVIQGDVYSAPGLLPTLLGSVIFALSFIMFGRSLYRSKGKVGVRGTSVKAFVQDQATRRIVLTLAVCVLYAVLLGKIYFPALTFLFVFSFVVCFEYERGIPWRGRIKKTAIAALLALVVSAAVTLTFERLFLVRLP